jgi:hypothetical protein
MDREARRVLEGAVADLREIHRKLEHILPQTQGTVRDELLEIQHRSEAAIRYYVHVLARTPRPNAPAIADRVAQAAFGGSCVGLVPPQFALPNGTH